MIRNNIYKILIAFLFLVLTWLMLFSYGHCASDQDYFPIEQNKNGHFNSDKITGIANYFDDENYYIICYYQNYNYFLVRYPKSEKEDGMLCGEKSSNLQYWSLYKLGSITTQFYQFQWSDYGEGVINLMYFGNNGFGYFSNLPSSNYNTGWDYISNLRVFTNNSSSKQLVINYEEEPIWSDPDNDTYPQNADEPNIDDYVPSNEPSFDNTDTISGLQSIFNFLTWLGNLIKGLFNYVVNALNWGLQKVINSIRNAINDLKTAIQTAISNAVTSITGFLSDIKDKVDDITEKLTDFADLFIHPFDEEEYEEQIANCQLISQYNQLIDNCEDIQAIFDNAEERDHFSLYIDFENPFADSQHRIISSEINFDWLVPLRSVYRPFLWVFALVDLFTGGMRLLGGIIGGKAK